MNRDTEKKIYELLGVNIFRKYILFTWEKIANLIHLPIGYRIENLSIDTIKKYKIQTKSFAFAHLACFFALIPLCSNPFSWIYNIFLNFYCIIVQRYNYLRIKDVEEKYEKLEKLKIKRQKRIDEKKRKANTLSLGRVNELISLFNVDSKVEDRGFKVIDVKPYYSNAKSPLDPSYWENNQNNVKTLTRKVS